MTMCPGVCKVLYADNTLAPDFILGDGHIITPAMRASFILLVTPDG